jgi:predicted peptidase
MKKALSMFVAFVILLTMMVPYAAASTSTTTTSHVKSVTAYTEIFGEGQKVVAVILEFDRAIQNSKLTKTAFSVTDRTITSVYANTAAERAAAASPGFGAPATIGTDGKFVVIELSTADAGASTIVSVGQGPSATTKKGTVNVTVKQVESVVTTDGQTYKSSSALMANSQVINNMVVGFKSYVFTDDKFPDEKLMYNLYIPENYDSSKTYPLVLFMPDASATSDDPDMTLIQGLGAQIWATPSEQAKHASIVLAPQYSTNNDSNNKVELTYDLLTFITNQYSVDKNRMYTTGQSAGCITSIALDIKYPNLFAASYLVAGQYEATEVGPLAKQNIWIVVSAGDIQALPGMNAITATLENNGGKVSRAIWDGQSTANEFAFNVAKMIAEDTNIKYTMLQKGTVTSADQDDPPHNHMGTWAIAYSIEGIRDWLFSQVKTDGYSAKELYNIGFKAFRAGDTSTAMVYFEKAAEMGDADATEMLGNAYQTGTGVDIDYTKAAQLNQKAIELGSARASTDLGIMYMNGQGVSQDYAKALELFAQATQAGDFKGPRYAGIIYYSTYVSERPDYAKAAEYFNIAATGGDVTANYYLGMMYEKGQYYTQDYTKALDYYQKAAPSEGHAEVGALVALGRMYEYGLGVDKDSRKAVEWYQKAAASGDSAAKAALKRLNAE